MKTITGIASFADSDLAPWIGIRNFLTIQTIPGKDYLILAPASSMGLFGVLVWV
jgi:hypothetical protein